MGRQLENIDLVYIDLGTDEATDEKKYYPVKLADSVQGDSNSIKDKSFDLFVIAFYSHHLPDWTKWNEVLLKFEIKCAAQKQGETAEINASYSLNFSAKDSSSPGGFLHKRIFKKAKTGDELELKITLDEIDEKFDIKKITSILTDTSIEQHLDLSGYTQYIKLGTEIYNRIADLAVKNDPLWKEEIVLKANNGSGGAAALKKGKYAIIATTDSKGNNISNWNSDYSNVFFKGKRLHIEKNENPIKTNYLVFSLDYYS